MRPASPDTEGSGAAPASLSPSPVARGVACRPREEEEDIRAVPARRARAFWITGPFAGGIRSETLPAPGAGEVLVETLYSGILRGMEGPVCAGLVDARHARTFRMPFQQGGFPFPVKYGLSCVGRVAEGPERLRGRTVFCPHPHQTRFVVPEDAVFPLPEGVPAERAVVAPAVEVAVEALRAVPALPGTRLLVVGAGAVGTACALLARRVPGLELLLVDVDPRRRAVCEALDLPFALPEEVAEGWDAVIHASGAPEALVRCLAWAGADARVVELSRHPGHAVPLPLGEAFAARRLELRALRVTPLEAPPHPRWDARRRMETALRLLADPLFDLLVSGESAFSELPRVLPDLARGGGGVLVHRIRHPAAKSARP